MLLEERRERILNELRQNGSVYVSQLSKELGVSYETIRKDLNALESQGLLIKGHGGATLKQHATEFPYNSREKENTDLKEDLAKKALSLIPEGSSVIIGTGSTNVELARLLVNKPGYKIFTDSLPVANLLIHSDNQVFFFGGELRAQSSSVFGGWTANQISSIRVDLCFLGTDGFSNFTGPTTPSSSDVYVDQVILKHSEKQYILADATKFSRNSLYKICDWSEVDGLITNDTANKDAVAEIAKQTQVFLS